MLAVRLLALSTVLGVAPPADEWELLGRRRVSFAAERDIIEVGVREGAFTAVKIEVEGGQLEMYNIRITFGNGDTWSPNTRVLFRQGSWSRTIDLPGPARAIRRVEFWYRSRVRRGQATVLVYGRSATPATPATLATPATPVPPVAPVVTAPARPLELGVTGEWDRLGGREVDARVDHDAIVAAKQGAFRALRLEVTGADLEMYDVKVTFGNGETFSPATRLVFREGTRSRVIDLPGAARIVRRIDFFYRTSLLGGRGKATVQVYGRR